MPKKLIQRFIPKADKLKKHKHLEVFGKMLHKPDIWVLNRKSTSGAFAIGLFCTWIPIPFQMLLAAALAVFFKVNLPVAVALVWISNPITMPIMFYGAYLLGANLLGIEASNFHFELSLTWLKTSIYTIGPGLLLGCLVLAIISAVTGYTIITNLWKYSTVLKWQSRRK